MIFEYIRWNVQKMRYHFDIVCEQLKTMDADIMRIKHTFEDLLSQIDSQLADEEASED